MTIDALIDKRDTFEVVRDKIAEILKLETVSQQALATAAGENPELWAFRVFVERANPWPFFQNENDVEPVVCVWYDSDQEDRASSNQQAGRSNFTASINVDCYGPGLAQDTVDGHQPGDLDAVERSQRVARLVRNILMAPEYHKLQLDRSYGIGGVWVSGRQSFQPQQDNQQTRHVHGFRLRVEVRFNEYAAENAPGVIEEIRTGITVDPSGEVVQTDIDFTA